MTINWDAVAAVSTAAAAVVALGLGWRSELRASNDARAADKRFERQLERQADARQAEFVLDRLLQLTDAFAETIAYNGMPQASLAGEKIPGLLRTLPPHHATLLRVQYGVDLLPEHGEIWQEFAGTGESLRSPVPTGWVYKELAANMRQAVAQRSPA